VSDNLDLPQCLKTQRVRTAITLTLVVTDSSGAASGRLHLRHNCKSTPADGCKQWCIYSISKNNYLHPLFYSITVTVRYTQIIKECEKRCVPKINKIMHNVTTSLGCVTLWNRTGEILLGVASWYQCTGKWPVFPAGQYAISSCERPFSSKVRQIPTSAWPRQIRTRSIMARLCDASVTGAWGRIDDSVTAGGLWGGARCMQPSIAAENTRQRIMKYYIPRVFVKQDNKKCRSIANEQKFRKLGSC